MTRASSLTIPSLLILSVSCGPDPDDSSPPLPPVDLTEALGESQARAGELSDDDLGAFIGGTSGEAQAGDFLLYNDRARFVVRGLRDGHWYVGQPGSLIDMDIVRPEGQADRDGLDELLTMAGFGRLFVAEDFRVLSDGRDGGAAVVQATGHDAAIPYIEGVLEIPGMFEPNGVEITQTFTLEPGSPALEITTTVHNVTDDDLLLDMLDAGMTDLASHLTFTPGAGFDGEAPDGDRPMLAMVSHMNDQAWGIYLADADMPDGLAGMGASFDMLLAQGDRLELDEGDSLSYTRLVGVARDQAGLEAHRRALRGLPTGSVQGLVTEAGSGEPVPGARVFLTDAEGDALALAFTDAQGAYSISHEPGDAWLTVVGDGSNEWMELAGGPGAYGPYAHSSTNERALLAYGDDPAAALVAPVADGHGRSEPVAVTLEDGEAQEQDLALPQRAWLDISTSDEHGDPLPAVVFIHFAEGVDDPQPADSRLGEERPRAGARKVAWVVDGSVTVPIPPGSYALTAHHGFEYELAYADGVQALAGETTSVELALEAAIDSRGWVSIDPHSHASPSLDGGCTIEQRLVTAIGNGLDVHVSTDHDHVSDFRPVLEAMGLGDLLVSVPGDEISPTVRGHHNIYPVEPDPTLPNGGAPRWWDTMLSTSELHALWKERVGEDGVLQVNHGRGSSGMFAAAEYDAEAGEPGEPDYFGDQFDTMEVLNSGGFGDAELLMADWCSLLDQGLRPTAVAVSDSHTRLSGAGFPRTWVRSDAEPPSDADVPALIAAIKAGEAVLGAGPLLEIEASAHGETASVGETLAASTATIAVRVQAPSWVPVERVQLFGDGCLLLHEWSVDTDLAEPPLWLEAEVELEDLGGGYVFALAQGSQSMNPAWGGIPWAMTNPVFFGD
jgi:hypothetical protein